jgi:hypothetical protein
MSHRLILEGNDGGSGITVTGMSLVDGIHATPSIENPILRGKNVYAPDIVRNGRVWNAYYGGFKETADVNDRIYFAVSDDLLPEGPWSGQVVAIDHGEYVHVNDPSVQKRSLTDWVMAYTVAPTPDGTRDKIAISTSRDGAAFSPSVATRNTEISISGANFTSMARPSLVWSGSKWLLWFDGSIDMGPRQCYLAESFDRIPKNFRLLKSYADVAGFPGFFEPDVEKVGDLYVAVIQRNFKTLHKMESSDGLNFKEVGQILSSNAPTFGRTFVSNPALIYDAKERQVKGVAFGMADSLTTHSIGFAYPQYTLKVYSPPDIVHVYTSARYFDHAIQATHQYDTYNRIVVSNPVTGAVVVDQEVNSRRGDIWRLTLA